MPEGPEIRVLADKIRNKLLGQTILAIDDVSGKCRCDIQSNSVITAVKSYGKKLIWELSTGGNLVFSFGLTGTILYNKGEYTKVTFVLSDFDVYYDDKLSFGNVTYHSDANEIYSKLGPDITALSVGEWLTEQEWKTIFRTNKGKGKKIYDVLLEQDRIAGIGWYLMNDILYYAGIKPTRIMKDITDEELEYLRICVFTIVRVSYLSGGRDTEEYPDGTRGGYSTAVYEKDIDKYGHKILNEKMTNGRTIYWVPEAQF